ncbi:hypothetical protein HAX54_043562 [Datura stramonium]|uniref:Uncharacterized protein n=1 Tax=Datura stramonium TaxID=4076 RepID=A0ABS8SNK2_DATST|nr:hypothetical protein [Datura stramonium]
MKPSKGNYLKNTKAAHQQYPAIDASFISQLEDYCERAAGGGAGAGLAAGASAIYDWVKGGVLKSPCGSASELLSLSCKPKMLGDDPIGEGVPDNEYVEFPCGGRMPGVGMKV